ncbi:MAG: CHAP domain-containing protein [Nitrososphaerota archaeon]
MALDSIYRRMKQFRGKFLTPEFPARSRLARAALVTLVGTAMLVTTFLTFREGAPAADAQALRVSSSATCAQLARIDPTVTNGSSWGRTVLRGHGANGGWFGVDVCSNGFNSVLPNGSNVSCDSTAHGCSPTNDGYGWTFQCPELIVRFSAWAFGDNPADWGRSGWGNAPDLWLPANHPSDFVMHANGSSTPPVPGDILVWGYLDSRGNPWPAGPDGSHSGHIAVVAAVHGNQVITAEQNVKWGNEDHPTDTLALAKVGSRWILSGSSQRATTLPTWRWLRTMGHSRGTFGWLHSVKNNGHFPNTHARSSTTAQKRTTAKSVAQQFPGGLPSLSAATLVTRNGTLADLTWSTQSLFTPSGNSSDSGQPRAQARSLGIPPGNIRLAAGQSAATLLLSNGSRYTYALGMDGNLYVARTTPASFGVFWSELGQPQGISLTGSPVASLFAGGVQIAARGSDGNLWWRAGPPDHPGNWLSLGSPSASPLTGSLALAGEPGTGSPIVFALGADGHIYLRLWQDATAAADGTQIPAAWSDWLPLGAQPAGHVVTGALLVVPELPSAHNWVGAWPDSPLNVFAVDNSGTLWWFRSTRLSAGWTVSSVAGNPAPLSALLGGVTVPAATNTSASEPSAQTIQLYSMSHSASYLSALTIPVQGKSTPGKPAWTTLPDPPAGVSPVTSGVAVPLGPGNSVLVASAGDDVVVGGSQAMTAALAPDVAAQAQGASGKKVTNAWVRLGAVPAATTFSDTFTSSSLDTRWTRSDASIRTKAANKGLVLVPGSHGVGALLQAAVPGDSALTVHVAKPSAAPAGGSVGLVLYQDDGDWLTLTVDRAGVVRLCAMEQQKAQPCLTGKVNSGSSVWLRIQRSGITFTASTSADDATWTQVGQWTPSAPDSKVSASAPTATATAHTTATATPQVSPTAGADATTAVTDSAVAPLAYTSWGVLAVGNGSVSGWPHMTDFTVTPAPVAP